MSYLHLFEIIIFLLTNIMNLCQIPLISSSSIISDEELSQLEDSKEKRRKRVEALKIRFEFPLFPRCILF